MRVDEREPEALLDGAQREPLEERRLADAGASDDVYVPKEVRRENAKPSPALLSGVERSQEER